MAGAFDTHKAYLKLTTGNLFAHEQAEALVALVNTAVVGSAATKSEAKVDGNRDESGVAMVIAEIEKTNKYVVYGTVLSQLIGIAILFPLIKFFT